jgi:phosphinothricin acetyltransferase
MPLEPTVAIEDANGADLEPVLAIYNEVIRNTTAVYSDTEFDAVSGRQWFETKLRGGFPFIVARDAVGIAGFGAFGAFRAWPCYRHSVEHSVHVRFDRRGQGIGRALLQELMVRAAALGKHVMVAAIDAENAASIRLHESMGFSHAGRFREVGFKFGRWLDVEFLQCIIPPAPAS